MSTQPEALRLAEICKDLGPLGDDLSKELRRLHEENKRLSYLPGFAGVTIWMGGKRITQLVSETVIKHERNPGDSVVDAAQNCLDQLAKEMEQS